MTQLEITEINEQVLEIDERQTTQEALRLLKIYRDSKLGMRGYDIKVTASYSIEPKAFGNEFRSNVEDNVIRKLDYLMMIESAVNEMHDPDERRIIVEGYMGRDKHSWVKMSGKLFMNKTDYYKLRNRALITLARLLNKEVYKYPRVME